MADRSLTTTMVSVVLALASMSATVQAGPGQGADKEDARQFIAFVEEFAGVCVQRNGVQVLVKSTHPSRKVQVWLDRYHMGTGTGDRSRTVLEPGAEPEALGCSRSLSGPQEWRIVRAAFVD